MSPETARHHLHAAGATVSGPPADLARTVLAVRRRRRRRTAAVAGAALAVLLVAVGVPALLPGPGPERAGAVAAGGGAVHSLPTRGGLAGDSALLAGLQQLPWSPVSAVSGVPYRGYDAADPAGTAYDSPVDLAAAVPADQRHVVWVDDVPGGRWALLAVPTDGGYAVAWFTGRPGVDAERMAISGPVQLVDEDEPVAHVDLADAERTLVVVAAPGAAQTISDRVRVEADGSTVQEFRELTADDGVAVTTLDLSVRYGVPATVQVNSTTGDWQGRPTAAGRTAGVPWGDDFGWGSGDPETPNMVLTRSNSGLGVSRVLSDTMLASVLGPTGLTLQTIDSDGPQITSIYSGTRDGGMPDQAFGDPAEVATAQEPVVGPSIAIWDVRLPSGVHAVMAGWSLLGDQEPRPEPAEQQTLLTLRGPDFDPTADLVATRMDLPAADGRPAETLVVVAGDPDGATVRLMDAAGEEVGRTTMRQGTATVPDPGRVADTVQVLDADGVVLQSDRLSSGIAHLAPDSAPRTYLTTPITLRAPVTTTPPAGSATTTPSTGGTPTGGTTTGGAPATDAPETGGDG